MDMQGVTTLIGNLGFPIAACVALFWYMNKQQKAHKEEMDKMSEAINNNTQVMQKFISQYEKVSD